MDQVKLNKEIEGNKTKRSTYFIRAINCSYSKILVIIKVTKMFLINNNNNNNNNSNNNNNNNNNNNKMH